MPRLILLALMLLIALGGGRFDLCGCGPLGHGTLCAEVPAEPSCCAEPPPPPCCNARESEADAPTIGTAGCACPELELAEVELQNQIDVDLPEALAPATLQTWDTTAVVTRPVPTPRARPPDPRPRYLLLNVFRC